MKKLNLLNVFVVLVYIFISFSIIIDDREQIFMAFVGFILIWILILGNNKFFESLKNINRNINKIYNKLWVLIISIIVLSINTVWSITNKTIIFPMKIYAEPLVFKTNIVLFIIMIIYFIDIIILLVVRLILIISIKKYSKNN